ncbi:PhzF family phenazine biosynthesis protein [Shimia sagamensis]|uniref:Trans-2,3-dihydro-3-hydroxyanthranilate isomerase n=1 Tax=Shimia sagamensis TaxID=1566352 RepID=A0ABY1PEW7_9RHOB|nr:PhzF family phenazine biosynthesis protein [Shimia sagamensis]SMP32296.1 trans-2,3-dihydro-3-hydroxyanthranilate isomerase [Shimia sagamensis]
MTPYFVYDVFTKNPFGGNQLAVIPDATTLPENDLQKIAREFNFSETTFVFPPENKGHTARVRIFTPTMEIPFAGHPIVGTACAMVREGPSTSMVLELGVGPLTCVSDGQSASFEAKQPLEVLCEPNPELVAEALRIKTNELHFQVHPPVMASLGLAFTITEVKSRDILSRTAPDVTAIRKGNRLYPSGLDFAQFVYVRDGNTIYARMFAPLDNIPEDPATGSACAATAALLNRIEGRDQALTIHQGVEMGRPSLISVTATKHGVTVAGHARRVMQGTLLHP